MGLIKDTLAGHFGKNDSAPNIAIVSSVSIDVPSLESAYVNGNLDVLKTSIYVYYYQTAHDLGTMPYYSCIMDQCKEDKIEYLILTDIISFKYLTKTTSATKALGKPVHCKRIEDEIGYSVEAIYIPCYMDAWQSYTKFNEDVYYTINTFLLHVELKVVTYSAIVHDAHYPKTTDEIRDALTQLLAMDCDLTIDVETFFLKHYDSGIGSISFSWNEHSGIGFLVDEAADKPNFQVRALLRNFFKAFRQKAIYHNICFDVYILVYQLFMDHILDQKGMLEGLDILLRNWDCTQIITYLATNTCAGNELGLKYQAREFAGNYALDDIHDITLIPSNKLLEYNLVDALCTWYVLHKNSKIMWQDKQDIPYQEIFKPSVIDIIQMQLTGLPINMKKVHALDSRLAQRKYALYNNMCKSPIIVALLDQLVDEHVIAKNKAYKKKVITKADVPKDLITFNGNSSKQLQTLLFSEDYLGLPVLDYTKKKSPATGGETLDKLIAHTKDPHTIELLEWLIEYKAISTILSTFIPAFLNAKEGPDGWYYLFGNFRLGGTVSGRLSSNNPNLQNIPSSGGSIKVKQQLAKWIKECVEAPEGWLFVGIDFDSLEDKISALTTRDPNKIKVYTDGYDGHCLRALSYFGEHMPDIDPNSVESINSIKKKHGVYRQEGKAPTFALTYQGTYITLMANCGFSEQLAKSIEKSYHELYKVSDDWVSEKLEQACKDGYVTLAFGLRLRTPMLNQVVLGTSKTPFLASAEGRTAGNALGQSYGALNNRASSAFMKIVRASKYRLDIRPGAHIHDAQYMMIRDNMETLQFTNKHLVEAVSWQELPEIKHDIIKMSGEVSVFYPNWNHEMTIPNDASVEDIQGVVTKHLKDLEDKNVS